jgi:hypothetical protein
LHRSTDEFICGSIGSTGVQMQIWQSLWKTTPTQSTGVRTLCVGSTDDKKICGVHLSYTLLPGRRRRLTFAFLPSFHLRPCIRHRAAVAPPLVTPPPAHSHAICTASHCRPCAPPALNRVAIRRPHSIAPPSAARTQPPSAARTQSPAAARTHLTPPPARRLHHIAPFARRASPSRHRAIATAALCRPRTTVTAPRPHCCL